jgi:deazaflavin-dependent oxidoreductase (nitroreductase family)
MKRVLGVLALSSVAIGTAGAIRFVRTQRPDDVREFVTHRFNPAVMQLGLAGGRLSPWGIIEHVGRTSGVTYRTPIWARASGDHLFVRLTYGPTVNWVRNVGAAGHCRLQVHGEIFELDEPVIVPASENPMVPPWARTALASRTYLRLHILSRLPSDVLELPDVPMEAMALDESLPEAIPA